MARSPFADFTSRHPAGEVIFRCGDPGNTLFVVQSGTVELLAGEGGGEPLAVMEKGDFFGEMSLLEGSPRAYTARAGQAAQVIELSPGLFDRMIRSNIELAVRMLRKLSIRLAEAEVKLATRPAGGRRTAARQMPTPTLPPGVRRPGSEPPPLVTDGPAGEAAASAAGRPPGAARLLHPDGREAFAVPPGNTRVGRFDPVTGTRPEVDLTLLDLKRSVSRRHALVSSDAEGYLVTEEVGALNGTSVNDRPLRPGEPVRLRDGDRLGFGGVVLLFHLPER
jgi:cyclic nucleotide-binding protein/FHA domain-containing protein